MQALSRFLDTAPFGSPSRRSVLLGMSVAFFAASCAEHPDESGRPASEPALDPAFLALSRSLTGHPDLDPLTAARLSDAFRSIAPEVHARFGDLSRLRVSDPQALLRAAAAHGLKAAALAIVAAWYIANLGRGPRNATVVYRDALMQRPLADAMLPSAYALRGLAWWTARPPDVDI